MSIPSSGGRNPEVCREACPLQHQSNFDHVVAACHSEPRIRLDGSEVGYKEESGTPVEIAKVACMSQLSPDKDLPTISMQTYADTPLALADLHELHKSGVRLD